MDERRISEVTEIDKQQIKRATDTKEHEALLAALVVHLREKNNIE